MKVLIFDREHNFTRWYVYWIPKTRTLGVTDGGSTYYERTCTIEDRMRLLNSSKTLLDDKWSDVFDQAGMKIEEISEKELTVSFACLQQITLVLNENKEVAKPLFSLLFEDRQALISDLSDNRKRTRTRSLTEEGAKIKKLAPVKKRVGKAKSKVSDGPKAVDQTLRRTTRSCEDPTSIFQNDECNRETKENGQGAVGMREAELQMLDLWNFVLNFYTTSFLFVYLTTSLLILKKRSWGIFPEVTLGWLELLLDRLASDEIAAVPSFGKKHLTPKLVEQERDASPFEMSATLLTCGIEAILQDDLSRGFTEAEKRGYSLLEMPKNARNQKTLTTMYSALFLFRWTFLLPLRVAFMITAVVFLSMSSVFCIFVGASQRQVRYCGVVFARFFNVATGLVVRSHDKHHRPASSGIVVSNHLSLNDVMTLYSDVPLDSKGYAVTAQSHGGFVTVLQKYGSYLTPVLLIDRENKADRTGLRDAILRYATQKDATPPLVFPEGFCVNNDVVLQFRKSAFVDGITFHPIAMKQNPRFGDSFWREDTYLPYLLRCMTSLALQIDIVYLPTMHKIPSEDEAEFARRVQTTIAGAIGRDALPYGGHLKKPSQRHRHLMQLQAAIAANFLDSIE
ncbi:unnamed protein product [Caenorhabditis auriculariae]|uniref:Phospholipid/glycerol acyltransferase domain-containing protein n=1 Tax=Caenorhabditis auriculariae TaxID=2777116 RepID=A0A8S1HDP7_9PELO|nr:unnamed protein product [Caenorhabditis auriculariae]